MPTYMLNSADRDPEAFSYAFGAPESIEGWVLTLAK